ncbi:MAG: carbohydrate ABC transporter permease [Caldilineaceae bacterium]
MSTTSLRPMAARSRLRWGKVVEGTLIYVAVLIALGIMLLPIIWLVLTSIRPLVEIASTRLMFIPHQLTLENYVQVFTVYHTTIYLRNSIIVCVGVVATNMVIGPPAAYALARYRFRGEGLFFIFIIFMRMIPLVAIMVPLFVIFSRLHLLNTLASLIIAHTAFKLPVTIWLLRAFIMDIPQELDDSARVDGCTPVGVLVRITLPLIKPGLAAMAVLAFLATWNDLLVTLILSNTIDTEMIALGLTKFVLEYGVAWGPLTAGGVLMFIPTLLFVFVAERYLVRGLTMGAVKE